MGYGSGRGGPFFLEGPKKPDFGKKNEKALAIKNIFSVETFSDVLEKRVRGALIPMNYYFFYI